VGAGLDVVPGLSVTPRKSFVNAACTTEIDPSPDISCRITPSLTGSIAINTDFPATEVEVGPARVKCLTATAFPVRYRMVYINQTNSGSKAYRQTPRITVMEIKLGKSAN
jgi:hypothetical protein